MTHENSNVSRATRREFLGRSGLTAIAAGATLASTWNAARFAHAAGGEEIKIALIGCGARGGAQASQALSTAGPVKLWAMADAFEDRLQSSLKNLTHGQAGRYDMKTNGGFAGRIDVPPERQFVGLDAFQKAIDCGVDMVVLAEPPGFRPDALRGRRQGRQARLHGKALGDRCAGCAADHGCRRRSGRERG